MIALNSSRVMRDIEVLVDLTAGGARGHASRGFRDYTMAEADVMTETAIAAAATEHAETSRSCCGATRPASPGSRSTGRRSATRSRSALMAALQAEIDAIAEQAADQGRGDRRRRPGLLRRPRSPRDARQSEPASTTSARSSNCSRLMQSHRQAAEAGDRPRARHRHRRRLPARRHLRPRGRRGDARFATPGVNIGLFCSTPMVAL